jgi:hypothetical protein
VTSQTSVTKTSTTSQCEPDTYITCPTLGRRFIQPGCSVPKCLGLENLKSIIGDFMHCVDSDAPTVTHVGACATGDAMLSARSNADCKSIVNNLNAQASAYIYQKEAIVYKPLTCRSYGPYTLIATNTQDGHKCA